MTEENLENDKINTEDTNEEDDIVSISDVIDEEERLEEDAEAVLGNSNHKICTYDEGYIKRQPLYSCTTCGNGALCLACSFECHDNHELVELYTKRNVRCDCGTDKVPIECQLRPNKNKINEDNTYNHNYEGLYCICRKPYPDPDDNSGDSMIQCVICEDWLHTRHCNGNIKNEEILTFNNYTDMTCKNCVDKNPYLMFYSTKYDSRQIDNEHEKADVKVDGCILQNLKDNIVIEKNTAIFWSDGWRCALCRCEDCKNMYELNHVEFLMDKDDSMQAYEAEAKTKSKINKEERLNKFIASMPRVQQNEVAAGIGNFATALRSFFTDFVQKRKSVVKETDVREFFDDFMKKKPRLSGIPPDNCK